MVKNRIKACWLLLLVLLFSASVLMSVGVAQARYINTTTAVAVVKSPDTGVTSNCLVSADDAPRTVLLGQLDWGESVMVPFWLSSSGSDAEQKLDWGVTDSKYADYLSICVFAGYEQLEADEKLELLEDIRLDLFLRIAPTEKAQTTPHEMLKINVHVTWGDEMWGTFQVILPAVAAPETEPTAAPTTEPETEPTEEVTTAPAVEETTEPTEAPTTEPTEAPTTEPTEAPTTEPTEAPTTEPTETPTTEPTEAPTTEPTEAPTTEPTEASTTEPTEAPTTEPTEAPTTEPTETPTTEPTEAPTTEPTEAPTTEPTEAPTTEPTEAPTTAPTEPVTVPVSDPLIDLDYLPIQPDLIQLKTIPSFNPAAEKLPVVLELDKNLTSVRLGVQKQYGDLTFFEPFPNYTMFSLDGGASYYMVYGDYIPEFGLDNMTSVPLLLNFSYAELDGALNTVETETEEYEELTLAMEAYTGNRLRKTSTAGTVPGTAESGKAVVRPQTESAILTVTDSEETSGQFPGLVLTADDTLEFSFPVEWEDAKLEYSVEFLTMTEEQVLKYTDVELTKEGLSSTYYKDDTMHKLVLRLGKSFAQPGTYRINMTWNYEEVSFAKTQTTFFVNCPARTANTSGGQEVQNDD